MSKRSTFLRVTTKDEVLVTEFALLRKVRQYVARVYGGTPMTVWKVIGTVHPHSGEAILTRTRLLLNPINIVEIAEVVPTTDDHQFSPANFRLKGSFQKKGTRGFWTAPSEEMGAVAGAVAGVEYPIRRDAETSQDYVILKVADGETPESRWYIASGTPIPVAPQDSFAEEADEGDDDAGDDDDDADDEDSF